MAKQSKRSAPRTKGGGSARQRPRWLSEGIVLAGNWEPLLFRRRSGLAGLDESGLFEREHAEETIRMMASLGVNLVMLPFDKGAGLLEEAPEIEMTKRLAALCHRHGLRVGTYIRYDTIHWETLYLERPDLEDHHAVAWDGQAPVYPNQTFRHFNCPNSEEWLAYVETRVRYAIEEIGADLIHFDGFSTGAEGATCNCDRCSSAFTRHLVDKYGGNLGLASERFGHAHLERIEPPKYHPLFRPLDGVDRVRDPALVEWIEHRCKLLARIHERLSRFIERLNPEVAVEVNTLVHTNSNAYLYSGVDLELIAPRNDVLWTEEPHDPRLLPSGVLVSRVREFKLGKALGNGIFSYIWGTSERQVRRSLAQSMAFSRDVIGHVGAGVPHEQPFWDIKKLWLDWWRANRELFIGAQSSAEVAIWRSRATLAHHCGAPHRSAVLCEQTLLQSQIPFDIILDGRLGELVRYRVVILPNVEAVSEAQTKLLASYVAGGGGLVVTEASGHFDASARQRPDTALRGLLGPDALSPAMSGTLGNWPHTAPVELTGEQQLASHVRREVGKGRVVYIPRLAPGNAEAAFGGVAPDARRRQQFPCEAWSLPANFAELSDAVKWAAGGRLQLELVAPQTVVCELTRVGEGTALHLVNFADKAALGIVMRLDIPGGKSPRRLVAHSPEEESVEIQFSLVDGRIVAEVPQVDIYEIIVVEMEPVS